MTWTKSEKIVWREVTCSECNLPSAPGLDPFIKGVNGLRHAQCPSQAEAAVISEWITATRQRDKDLSELRRKVTFGRKWSVR